VRKFLFVPTIAATVTVPVLKDPALFMGALHRMLVEVVHELVRHMYMPGAVADPEMTATVGVDEV